MLQTHTRPTAQPEIDVINAMAHYATTAQRGGWNVLVRDNPTHPQSRRMDGLRGSIWFRLEAHGATGAWSFRARLIEPGSTTHRLARVDHIKRLLSGVPLEADLFLPSRSQLRDKDLPLHLK